MMQHRLLGGTGLRVSSLCLGTLTFGDERPWGADEATSAAMLGAFAEAGGTFIDTAPNYGEGRAEEIVGKFLKGRRDKTVVATKFTASLDPHPLAGGNGRKAMRASVEASLKRLGTDYIDLLWMHFWDGTTPLEEILRGLDDLMREGKILYAGLSDTPAWLVSRALTLAEWRGWDRIAAIQIEYNIAARTPERELLPMAAALDLGVVCWGPLAAGALAGGEPTRMAKLPAPLAAAASALADVSRDTDYPAAALAIGWLIGRGHIPLIGARTGEQLAASLAMTDIPAEILARIDAIMPPEPGFPHALIGSSYLRRFALGDPQLIAAPRRPRA
ncbi:aldo/keto reductase [Sphingopyxis granuli]|uniref:aldo/keto reductase n=1 Tax=Sphingopyxis granuli TaxID=267128 RepID=UPI00301C4AF5